MQIINPRSGITMTCNYDKDKHFSPDIGDTIKINDVLYIVIGEREYFSDKILDFQYVFNNEAYQGIKITFPSNPSKSYDYFIQEFIADQLKIGDKIKVKTPYGISEVQVMAFFDLLEDGIQNAKKELLIVDSKIIANCTNQNKKENKTMNINANKLFKNLEFGKVRSDAIKFSINGLAFKQEDGSYATYDVNKHEFTDVSAFVFDTDFIFAMPVAANTLKKGDIVRHMNKYVVVLGFYEEDNTIKVADPFAGEEKVLIPTKNMFGFNYYTKIMNIFEGFNAKPDANNPFGNLMPLMFADGSFDATTMLAMAMMQNGTSTDMMSNPLMMMALLKNDK
jgi:hypothetical protein